MVMTTAKSQVLAVCCAACASAVGLKPERYSYATAGQKTPKPPSLPPPAPALVQWVKSPAMFRSWAEDWVLRPESDAVFRLSDSCYACTCVCVSVSPTLGVVCHSYFRLASDTYCCCVGSIGPGMVVLKSLTSVDHELYSYYNYGILDVAQQQQRNGVVGGYTMLGPGACVLRLLHPIQFSQSSVDDIFYFACEAFHDKYIVIVDLNATSQTMELVFSDGTLCELDLEDSSYTLRDITNGNLRATFPHAQKVTTLDQNHVLVCNSSSNKVTSFSVYHTGDLLSSHLVESLSVPSCTWVGPSLDLSTLVLSTATDDDSTNYSYDIKLSLHDGATGFHIGNTPTSFSSQKSMVMTTAKSQVLAVCCAVGLKPEHSFAAAAAAAEPPSVSTSLLPSALVQWIKSPAMFRSWAEDWVLRPESDAVFRLPQDSCGECSYILASDTLCCCVGVIGPGTVVVQSLARVDHDLCSYYNYGILDVGDVAQQKQLKHGVEGATMLGASWEAVEQLKCSRNWIVGHSWSGLFILKVASGRPAGKVISLNLTAIEKSCGLRLLRPNAL
ncbi:hypothetical protein Pelo_18008 [Pelomyxa schiedti]|nr:hypothetical protein Pelo_18008 [Pelomyxa schiedti]